MSAGHIAVAVAGEESSEHTLGSLLATRQHGSYAGANRALADDEPSFAGNECLVPDLDAGHIRDCVQRSGCPIEWHPEIARARLCMCLGKPGRTRECSYGQHRKNYRVNG